MRIHTVFHYVCKCALTTGMLHFNRNKVGRSVVQKIILSMTRVNKVIYQATSLSLWSGLSHFKDICGYFQCAPFPRLQTGKVVWVLSFDP